ncbi:MAG: ATP-binding cassette domain-containing protein [Candidatus Accumulibacter sp.]|jgi:putative ATP-binding cassette transporter|nr:ATP-binding cassette domain-containing protein [Accumulibacter sp.]
MIKAVKGIWNLTCICVRGRGGRIGLVYCAIVLMLNLAEIQIALKMIAWNKDFYGALEKYDAHAAVWQIGVFGILTGLSASQYLIATYIRQLLQIRWRTTLTTEMLDAWMKNKAYWHINTADASLLDNPDQRISEDCRVFVERLVGGGSSMGGASGNVLDFMTALVGLTNYVVLLWNLSSFSIGFSVAGYAVKIEHYMVWAAPLYVLISSGLTHWLGAPLMRLNVRQKRREADMRFALTRFRESKEAIALEDGEAAERRVIDLRYASVVENWRKQIKRELILGCFTRPYYQTVLRIPLFLAFPAYFAGHVAIGGLMQLSSAFQRVVTSLSWFIFSYKSLADLAATSKRIDGFLAEARRAASLPTGVAFSRSPDGGLHIRDLRVDDPQGRPLLRSGALDVKRGEAVWIDGPSGIGKSTLIKAISGLWQHCGGNVEMPDGKKLFLPQYAYLPLGTLAAAVSYPEDTDTAASARRLLIDVGLGHERHLEQLNGTEEMPLDYKLSGGEQQRLIVARILSLKPDWVFMDEATSALDVDSEFKLYELLRAALPDAGFIVAAHREPHGLGSYRRVALRAWRDETRMEMRAGSEAEAEREAKVEAA